MCLSIELDDSRQLVVVHVGKALDMRTAATFKAACHEKLLHGARHFVLDFTDTGSLDSMGLGTIFSLYRQVVPRGGHVVFASMSDAVGTVVRLTRTYKIFRQYPTVQEATSALA